MNNKPAIYILSALMIALLSSCGTQPSKTMGESEAIEQVEDPSASTSTSAITNTDRENYRTAITALYKNDVSKAQRLFSAFIRQHPKLAGAYTNLALCHYKKQQYEDASKQVNKAIELNPKQAQAYNLRGQLLQSSGKINDAKKDFLKAVELKPGYANAQYNLALLYDIYLQEIELAIKHYELYMTLIKKPDEKTKEWINHLKGTLKNA